MSASKIDSVRSEEESDFISNDNSLLIHDTTEVPRLKLDDIEMLHS